MQLCPYCQSPNRSGEVVAREMSQGTRESFVYHLCADCGSAHIDEIPADIGKYYESYFSLAEIRASAGAWAKHMAALLCRPALTPAQLNAIRPHLRHPPRWMWPFLSPNLQAFLYLCPPREARILDVGSGNGAFVANLRHLGFHKARGIDPLIDVEKLHHQKKFVDRAEIDEVVGEFDIVMFNHSLEHMPSPGRALALASDLLAPGGTVIVHIPNIESVEFQRFGGNWWGLHAPRHLSLPTVRGLALAAENAGLMLSDQIFTSRHDNYLYSAEYERDIADHDPGSFRAGGAGCIWNKKDIDAAANRARIHNATGMADWVCYYLNHADEQPWKA